MSQWKVSHILLVKSIHISPNQAYQTSTLSWPFAKNGFTLVSTSGLLLHLEKPSHFLKTAKPFVNCRWTTILNITLLSQIHSFVLKAFFINDSCRGYLGINPISLTKRDYSIDALNCCYLVHSHLSCHANCRIWKLF